MAALRATLFVTAFSNVALATFLRKPTVSASRNATASGNISSESDKLPSLEDGCKAPDGVITGNSNKSVAFLASSKTHALYGIDEGPEIALVAFDCQQGKRLIFVHIPKNAGTTIENLGAEQGIVWGWRAMMGKTQMPDGNKCSTWHVPPSSMYGYNPYAEPDVELFCVTRDPWERALSEHVYTSSLDGDYHLCNVPGFNSFLSNAFTEIRAGRRWINDCHMLPQWDFIAGPDGRQWCNHILPIEDLVSRFNALMLAHGLAVRMPPYRRDNDHSSDCPALKQQANENMGSVYYDYNKAQMRLVYATDFYHLGDSLQQSYVSSNTSL